MQYFCSSRFIRHPICFSEKILYRRVPINRVASYLSGAATTKSDLEERKPTDASKKTKPKNRTSEYNPREQYSQWLSIKNLEAKTAILLQQGELVQGAKSLLPRHLRIQTDFSNYLKVRFPQWNKTCDDDSTLRDIESTTLHSDQQFAVLSQTLSKVYANNQTLSVFSDVSVAAGEFSQFLRLCNSLRRVSNTHRELESGAILLDTKIFETLARYFASKADWSHLAELIERLESDGLTVSPRIYLWGIECLGRLLARRSSTQHVPVGMNLLLPDVSREFLKDSTRVDKYLVEQLQSLMHRAMGKGYNLENSLPDLPRSKSSLQFIRHGLSRIQPDLTFNIPLSEPLSDQQNVVLARLETVPHKRCNAFAHTGQTIEEMMSSFQEQLALERKGFVHITPVLTPFPTKDEVAGPKRSTPSPGMKLQLRQSLLEEQTRWRSVLRTAFGDLLQRFKRGHARDKITVYPFLKILPINQYVDLMIQAIDTITLDSNLQHVSSHMVSMDLGQRVEAACRLFRAQKAGVLDELQNVYSTYAEKFHADPLTEPGFREIWQKILQSRFQEGAVSLHQEWPQWTSSIQTKVGRALYSLIYDRLTFHRSRPTSVRRNQSSPSTSSRDEAPVLYEVLTEMDFEVRNEVKIHPTLARWYRDADYPPLSFHPAKLPMLCPPVPWTNLEDAGYLIARNYTTRLMRHSHASPIRDPALNDDLDFQSQRIPAVLDALNCLAACPWRVNKPVLDDLIHVARSGGNRKLSIPETSSLTIPTPLAITQSTTYQERREAHRKAKEAQKQYDETRSLYATELYRLSIANQYRDRIFWFPHSMDFRGRVYPCPPHFHHMGSDVARGLIVFAKGVPLGASGLDWLKIHLVNLTGTKKRCPNSERLDYANSIQEEILDSAHNPFTGRGWWREQEEPWQTLACCRELAAALAHPNGPEFYHSNFPVHQDGSCNGLQHYAALGRDRRGAESVNLTDMDQPQDVYSDVVDVVEAQRRKDAAAGLAVAQVLEGFVRRKVIKQSVMTTVYGVTLYGASTQIQRQLRDLDDFPSPDWIGPAAAYLARVTLKSIGAIFTSSADIQLWFGQIANHISRHFDRRVSWESPLGLPITQPYMSLSTRSKRSSIADVDSTTGPFSPPPPPCSILGPSAVELAQAGVGTLHNHSSRSYAQWLDVPVPNVVKQKNAFPPNFVHSLDSCHMMLTALHCFRQGITFASVHDCFWTHAATVDAMNRICREEFIALHSEPVLENLADYLRQKFAYNPGEIALMTCEMKRAKALAFNELLTRVPKPGTFDLDEVRDSTYFFS